MAANTIATDDNDAVDTAALTPVDDDEDEATPVDDDEAYGGVRLDTPMTPRAIRPPAAPTDVVWFNGLPSSRNVCNTTPRPMIEPMPWKVNKSKVACE